MKRELQKAEAIQAAQEMIAHGGGHYRAARVAQHANTPVGERGALHFKLASLLQPSSRLTLEFNHSRAF
jgi:hypothetical protein